MQGFEGCRPSHRKSAGQFKRKGSLGARHKEKCKERCRFGLCFFRICFQKDKKSFSEASGYCNCTMPQLQTPKLPVTPSPQPPKRKTAGKPKKNSTTQKGQACKSERVFNLDKATAENSPSLESSLDKSSKLDKLLSLVENMNARIQTLFFFERSAAATKALR